MKDYFNIINGNFLDKLQIKDDDTGAGIKEFLLLKDRNDVENIITKEKYEKLNEFEILILKKMYISIIKYNDAENNAFLSKKINELLSVSNEELLVFFLKNKFSGLFSLETCYFNSSMYIGISEGKNNISNSNYYEDSEFLKIYFDIIKSIMNLFIKVDDKIIKKIIDFEVNLYKLKMTNDQKRNIKEIINIYKISEVKFQNFNFQKLLKMILNDITYERDDIILDEKSPSNFYTYVDSCFKDSDFKYYLIWCMLSEIYTYTFGTAKDLKFKLIMITK
jgi:predicted metalloendopeptidase